MKLLTNSSPAVAKPTSFNLVSINCKKDVEEEGFIHTVYKCKSKEGKITVAQHWFNDILNTDHVERYRTNWEKFIDDVLNDRA